MNRANRLAALISFAALGALATSCALGDYSPPANNTGNGGAGGNGSSTSGSSGEMGGMGMSSSSTSGSMSGSTSSSSTSSSTGGMPVCLSEKDCVVGNPCLAVTCNAGQCVYQDLTGGDDIKPDAVGDCKRWICLMGKVVSQPDSADAPIDGNECTSDLCLAAGPANPPMVPGSCEGGSGVCAIHPITKVPICGECNLDLGCGGEKCIGGFCYALECSNGLKDGLETDVDCGGDCAPCEAGKGCTDNADCMSDLCSNGKLCAQPTCSDNTKNGTESDIDCGGGGCAGCPANGHCNIASDCSSKICYKGVCRTPTCQDNQKNGEETGVDCGGTCSPCGP